MTDKQYGEDLEKKVHFLMSVNKELVSLICV